MKLEAADIEMLRPVVKAVMLEVLAEIRADEAQRNGRLSYTQPEAAALLGVEPTVLRDCRLRGELQGSKVGKRIVYARDELVKFLERRKIKD